MDFFWNLQISFSSSYYFLMLDFYPPVQKLFDFPSLKIIFHPLSKICSHFLFQYCVSHYILFPFNTEWNNRLSHSISHVLISLFSVSQFFFSFFFLIISSVWLLRLLILFLAVFNQHFILLMVLEVTTFYWSSILTFWNLHTNFWVSFSLSVLLLLTWDIYLTFDQMSIRICYGSDYIHGGFAYSCPRWLISLCVLCVFFFNCGFTFLAFCMWRFTFSYLSDREYFHLYLSLPIA
jgi:hypothetical protein